MRLAIGIGFFVATMIVAWAAAAVIRFAFGYAEIDDRSNP